jgi:uncharacterized protein YaaN involved in tellurite resistance
MGDIIKKRVSQLLEDIEETERLAEEILESSRLSEEELISLGVLKGGNHNE